MAKKAETAVTEVNASEAAETAVKVAGEEEFVEVQLFKDSKDYKDDVFVCINGRNKVIKRGEKVKVSKAYAKVLEQSMKQDGAAADLMNQKADEFSAEVASRNI